MKMTGLYPAHGKSVIFCIQQEKQIQRAETALSPLLRLAPSRRIITPMTRRIRLPPPADRCAVILHTSDPDRAINARSKLAPNALGEASPTTLPASLSGGVRNHPNSKLVAEGQIDDDRYRVTA